MNNLLYNNHIEQSINIITCAVMSLSKISSDINNLPCTNLINNITLQHTEDTYLQWGQLIFSNHETEKRYNINIMWLKEYLNIMEIYEYESRKELERLERITRDAIKRYRALCFKTVIKTSSCKRTTKLYAPPVLSYSLEEKDYIKKNYNPYTPTKSSIKNSNNKSTIINTSIPNFQNYISNIKRIPSKENLEFCRLDLPICDDIINYPQSNKSVTINNKVIVQKGPEIDIIDWENTYRQWKIISSHSPIRYMVMASLKERFGSDSSCEDSWVHYSEQYSFLDDIFSEIKNTYQLLHEEEEYEWNMLMDKHEDKFRYGWWDFRIKY